MTSCGSTRRQADAKLMDVLWIALRFVDRQRQVVAHRFQSHRQYAPRRIVHRRGGLQTVDPFSVCHQRLWKCLKVLLAVKSRNARRLLALFQPGGDFLCLFLQGSCFAAFGEQSVGGIAQEYTP